MGTLLWSAIYIFHDIHNVGQNVSIIAFVIGDGIGLFTM